MASIYKEIVIDTALDNAWDALRDVGALHTRLVPGFVIDTRIEPGARIVTFGNGQVFREWILAVDEMRHRVAWAIHDQPFDHYSASAQVFAEGDGRCRFVWIADLLPDAMAEHVGAMMDQGLRAIATTLGGAK